MKNSRFHIIIGTGLIWLLSITAVYFFAAHYNHLWIHGYEGPVEHDTIVKAFWDFGYFQFYYKHIEEGTSFSSNAFSTIHLNQNDKSFFLFNCNPNMDEEVISPQRLFDNVYSFPYSTGGNYSRSSGVELFRVRRDTVVSLGRVCGYDDIDKNGKKEFWVYIVSEYGEGNAFNKLEKVLVKLSGDSLIYPFLDGGY